MEIRNSSCMLRYLCLLPVVLLIGCTQTVSLNKNSGVSGRELATLEFSYLAKVKIDHQEIAPNRGAFTHYVRVKLPPKYYSIEWVEGCGSYTYVHQGEGILHARPGQKYVLKNSYLPGATRLTGVSLEAKHFSTEVLDYASWIENAETRKVVVGRRPEWAESDLRPQILYR